MSADQSLPSRLGQPKLRDLDRYIIDLTSEISKLQAELTEARVPGYVTDAAVRIRSDVREAIEVLYGDIGGEGDTNADVENTYRAIATDMATILDWLVPTYGDTCGRSGSAS